jgi:hypothetical protein
MIQLVQPLELSRLRFPSSSRHLSMERRRAFMKKLATVVTSNPSCCAIVACISFDGRLVSLKIAWRVRRWISVKTSRGFFGGRFSCGACWEISCSFLLHAAKFNTESKSLATQWVASCVSYVSVHSMNNSIEYIEHLIGLFCFSKSA